MSNLDYSKIDTAKALVAEGNKTIDINCSCCQGMSLTNDSKSPGYCPQCGGKAYVSVPAWTHWFENDKLDYWQARALIAEYKLMVLMGI